MMVVAQAVSPAAAGVQESSLALAVGFLKRSSTSAFAASKYAVALALVKPVSGPALVSKPVPVWAWKKSAGRSAVPSKSPTLLLYSPLVSRCTGT